MEARILALHCGHPAPVDWNGKTVQSSIAHRSVPGPLVAHMDHIEGNSFAVPKYHGLEHSVLYAYGLESARAFARRIGLPDYEPGLLGENISLDALDEDKVSVGDIFEFGEVLAQATYPRIPCNRVSYRVRHADGQKELELCGRSGIYFRILRPGKIYRDSLVRRVREGAPPFPVSELYRKVVAKLPFTEEEMRRGVANGAFPRNLLEKWAAALKEPK